MVMLVIINAKCSTVYVQTFESVGIILKYDNCKCLFMWCCLQCITGDTAVQGAVSTVEALDQMLEFKWHEHGMVVHSKV